MVVGAGLAVAGATFQGLLRNPLADPYVLGTASGAALGAAIAVLIPVRVALLEFGLLNALAFAGALAAVAVVYRLSAAGPLAPLTGLLLTGYAVGSLLAAGLAMTMYLSGTNLRQIFAFLLGGLDGSSWLRLAVAAPLDHRREPRDPGPGPRPQRAPPRRGGGRPPGRGRPARAGDPPRPRLAGHGGRGRGLRPHRLRRASWRRTSSASSSGPNARLVLPLAALLGAGLLVAADLVARLLGEIPVGVVTAVIGAPFFLALLRRRAAGTSCDATRRRSIAEPGVGRLAGGRARGRRRRVP